MTDLQLVKKAPEEPQEQKLCTKCKQPKGLGEFYKDSRYKTGVNSWCRSCHSNRSNAWNKKHPGQVKLTRYGVDFNKLWLSQSGLCAVCNEPMSPTGRSPESVVVDHDHNCCKGQSSCGKCVRGLIHSRCNRVLGSSLDNPKLLQSAAAYVLRWRGGLT